jgi:hypothetical protein
MNGGCDWPMERELSGLGGGGITTPNLYGFVHRAKVVTKSYLAVRTQCEVGRFGVIV